MIDRTDIAVTQHVSVPVADTLVVQCIEHLENESEALSLMIDALRAVRAAIEKNDMQRMGDLLQQQQQAASRLMEVREHRQQFRRRLAVRLRVAEEDVTISQWIPQLSIAAQKQVSSCRDQVARLAKEAAALTSSNLAVLTSTMQLFGDVLRCLVGDGGAGGVRYSASGATPPDSDHRLINQRM